MITETRQHPPLEPEEQRRIRCAKIVEHVYWSGSTSLQELSADLSELPCITDSTITAIDQDIDLLRHQGLPVNVDDATGRWRIDGIVPGFALRLTAAEARALWAWCVARTSFDQPTEVPASVLSESAAILLSGLRRYHRDSEMMTAAGDATTKPESSRAVESGRRIEASELVGEARMVHRRLRILDLIDGGKALTTTRLAAVLEVSKRTVHDDLNVLRCCSWKIKFCRRRQVFQIQGLKSYLSGCLTPPMAAALLVLLQPPATPHNGADAATPFKTAAEKLVKSIRLIFEEQPHALQDLMARYQASEAAN